MKKYLKSVLALALAAALITACLPANLPAAPAPASTSMPQQDVQATIAAGVIGTLQVASAQTAAAQPTTEPTAAPTTAEPQPPTAVADTATPAQPPTQPVAMVHVDKDTNCRKGPRIIYDYIGALMVGEQAEMVGRLNNNSWWVIRNLDAPGHCWITAQYATPEGPYQQLPVMTPPPPPTPTPYPALEASFASRTTCGADVYYVFNVRNAGTTTFESAQVSLTNVTLSQSTGSTSNSPFWPQTASCAGGAGSLAAGKSAYVAVKYAGASTGQSMQAAITTCSRDDLKGTCVTQSVSFASP